ncbi:hypothetical protein HanIR_Chr17g0875611 [Helianthus annuus]|nr:hypothetical protein HanIR_Chr17g0875611 [Helianthus annuus]
MLVWSSTSLNRFFDHDHLVVTFSQNLKLVLISFAHIIYGFNYLYIYIESALLVYHIQANLTQSCAKIMIHKFMSYFSVSLNGSYNINRAFRNIYCFIIFNRKTLFNCFNFNRKSY